MTSNNLEQPRTTSDDLGRPQKPWTTLDLTLGLFELNLELFDLALG